MGFRPLIQLGIGEMRVGPEMGMCSLVSATEIMPVSPGLRGTWSQATTSLPLQIIPRFTLSLGGSNVSHHSSLFPGWRQGQQPKVHSSSTTVISLITAPMKGRPWDHPNLSCPTERLRRAQVATLCPAGCFPLSVGNAKASPGSRKHGSLPRKGRVVSTGFQIWR